MVKCILENFKYAKKEGEVKEYSLLLLNEAEERYRSGIDLNLLTPEEKEEVVKIQKEYEVKIEPFVKKAYRTFIVDKIVKEQVK